MKYETRRRIARRVKLGLAGMSLCGLLGLAGCEAKDDGSSENEAMLYLGDRSTIIVSLDNLSRYRVAGTGIWHDGTRHLYSTLDKIGTAGGSSGGSRSGDSGTTGGDTGDTSGDSGYKPGGGETD